MARNLRRDFVEGIPSPHQKHTVRTIQQLAKWCKTDGIYYEGMQVARKISRLLFGEVLDRGVRGVTVARKRNARTPVRLTMSNYIDLAGVM